MPTTTTTTSREATMTTTTLPTYWVQVENHAGHLATYATRMDLELATVHATQQQRAGGYKWVQVISHDTGLVVKTYAGSLPR